MHQQMSFQDPMLQSSTLFLLVEHLGQLLLHPTSSLNQALH